MKKNLSKKTTKKVKDGIVMICLEVFGANWKGNVPNDYGTGTSSSNAVTVNADLAVVTSESLTAAAGANATPIALTNSRIVAGTVVRASITNYAGTTGWPAVICDAPDTSAHTVNLVVSNVAGSGSLNGAVTILVEVVTLPV